MSEQQLTNSPQRQSIQVIDPVPLYDTGRFEHMARIAKMMAQCTMIPDALCKEEVNDKKVFLPFENILANCFLVVNISDRWGMDPFAVAQCVSLVHGRLCFEGKLIKAVIDQKLGLQLIEEYFDEGKGDAMGVNVYAYDQQGNPVVNPRTNEPLTVSGTVAGWRTTNKGSPWLSNSAWKRQLSYRGSREWARQHRPAIMLGVYTDDEMVELESPARSSKPREAIVPNIPAVPPVPVKEPAQIESKPIVSTTPVKPIEPVNLPEKQDSSAIPDVPPQTSMRETVLQNSTQAPLISQDVDREEPDALKLSEMADAGDDDISTERRYEIFVEALSNCISEEEAKDAWEALVMPYAEDMFPGDYDRFSKAYDTALLRFAPNPPLQNEPSALLLKKAESVARNGRKNLAAWLKALSEDDFAKLKPQVKRLYEIADKIK